MRGERADPGFEEGGAVGFEKAEVGGRGEEEVMQGGGGEGV